MTYNIDSSFSEDVKAFASNHKVLCVLTLGLAVAVYSLGNLAGRAVSWISECRGTTKKVNDAAKEIISPGEQNLITSESHNESTPNLEASKFENKVGANQSIDRSE